MTIGKKTSLERRKFLGTLGASAGAAAVAAGSLGAHVPAAAQKADEKNAAPLKIIDFHNHYMGPSLTLTNLAAVPPAQKQYWERVNRKLADPAALTASIESAGIAARVINTPTAFIEDADGKVAADVFPRINDHLAELVSRNPGRLYGLATVDAYSGDAGAQELTRAVRELGLRGVFVESEKNDLLLDAKEARPTLAAAAALGIPVFVHPITDPTMHKRFAKYGRLGVRLARSTIHSPALCARHEGAPCAESRFWRLVRRPFDFGAVRLPGASGEGYGLRSDAPALTR